MRKIRKIENEEMSEWVNESMRKWDIEKMIKC